jgi:F0F1-type ATP synthase membrane subunit b/b'
VTIKDKAMRIKTMDEEVELLHKAAKQLREQKVKTAQETLSNIKETITETIDESSIADLKNDLSEQLKELSVQLKKDYDQISPATVLLLLGLGVLIGRASVSK